MSKHSARGAEWEAIRQYILNRDGYTCVLCGQPAISVDHIIPRSRGGTDEEHNLQSMCRDCNSRKGDRLMVRGMYWDETASPHGLPNIEH